MERMSELPENLFTHPVHLGLGAKALAQPEFTGMLWYEAYSARHAGDGAASALFITAGLGTQHKPR
jgi:hypothetical protein